MIHSPCRALIAVVLSLVFGPASALDVMVISDLNGSYGSTRYGRDVHRAVAAIVERRPDLVLVTGDMVAGQRRPVLPLDDVERMWAAFDRDVAGPLREAGIPLAAAPGNHDASAYIGFSTEREAYRAYWGAPPAELNLIEPHDYPFRYAFALDGALFIALDVTVVGRLPAAQRTWLADLLAATVRAGAWRLSFEYDGQGRGPRLYGRRRAG